MRWLLTIGMLLLSAALTHFIPGSDWFRNLDTMIHELGHAIVTLILSGEVMAIELFANHGGVTYSRLAGDWRMIPVSLAGYVTASVFAWLMFQLRAWEKQRLGLQLITVIAALCVLLFVRNLYGVMWLVGFIAITVTVLALAPEWLRNGYYLLLSFLTLEESVSGPLVLVMLAVQSGGSGAGDATNLERFTHVPAIIWALVFTGFALIMARQALRTLWRTKKAPTIAK